MNLSITIATFQIGVITLTKRTIDSKLKFGTMVKTMEL